MNEDFFTLIEAPIYQGQSHFGVSLGPTFINQSLRDQDYRFQTYSVSSKQSRENVQLQAYRDLSLIVEREVRLQTPTFIVGGDHSLSIGSIQGLLRVEPNLKVVWVDAHGDINTSSSSTTGALHGMPLSYLVGEDHFTNAPWFTHHLRPENLIYFGVRDLDKAEKLFLDKKNVCHFTTNDIQKIGLSQVLQQIKNMVSGAKIHLSVDSDAFDPSLAPSTGIKVPQGLSIESVKALTKSLAAAGKLISYEFVELNPQIFNSAQDVHNTAQIGIDLLKIFLAQEIAPETDVFTNWH